MDLEELRALVEGMPANETVEVCVSSVSALLEEISSGKAEIERLRNIPVDVVLHCPVCLERHVDAPQPEKNWTNPPHRTHECQHCGHLWRPYDVATNGVKNLPEQLAAWNTLKAEISSGKEREAKLLEIAASFVKFAEWVERHTLPERAEAHGYKTACEIIRNYPIADVLASARTALGSAP